jgi:hypothetical protein
MTTPTKRERFIDGHRVIASILENHPEIPLPSLIGGYLFGFYGDGARERMAEAARIFPCSWAKDVSETEYGDYFKLKGQIGGIKVELSATRESICRKVVTGTHEVTEMVKDPAKLAEVPEVEVTRVVEDVTWDCGSLLAPQVDGKVPAAVTG